MTKAISQPAALAPMGIANKSPTLAYRNDSSPLVERHITKKYSIAAAQISKGRSFQIRRLHFRHKITCNGTKNHGEYTNKSISI